MASPPPTPGGDGRSKARWPADRKATAAAAREAGGAASATTATLTRPHLPPDGAPGSSSSPGAASGAGWWVGGGGGGQAGRAGPPPHARSAVEALAAAFRAGGVAARPPPLPQAAALSPGLGPATHRVVPLPVSRRGPGQPGQQERYQHQQRRPQPPPPPARHGDDDGGDRRGRAGQDGATPPAFPPSATARPVLRPTRPPPGLDDPNWYASAVSPPPARPPPPPTTRAPTTALFAEHWEAGATAAGLATQALLSGVLRVHAGDRSRGYVYVARLPCDVMIRGLPAQNRAVDGDTVALQLNPPAEWWVMRAGAGRAASSSPAPPDADLVAAEAAAAAGATAAAVKGDGEGTEGGGGEGEAGASPLAPVIARLREDTDLRPTAAVVAILNPSRRRAVIPGTLSFLSKPGAGRQAQDGTGILFFSPVDLRLPAGVIRPSLPGLDDAVRAGLKTELRDTTPGAPRTLVTASLDAWECGDAFPTMRVTAALGPAGDLAAELAAACAAEGVDAAEFPDEALAELPPNPWCLPPEAELAGAGRADLRPDSARPGAGRLVVSIDPPTARDLDDALSVTRLKGEAGECLLSDVHFAPHEPRPPPTAVDRAAWRVGVHIADVAAFVKAGGALDAAAASRATSTYLVSSVIPMLPRALCEGACSLTPGSGGKFALCVDLWLDGRGESVAPPSFYRATMASAAQLAYGDAEAMLKAGGGVAVPDSPAVLAAAGEAGRASAAARGKDPDAAAPGAGGRFRAGPALWAAMAGDVRALGRLAACRAATRAAGGALRLDNTKLAFRVDPASGAPLAATPYPRLASHSLIEEFMLAANMAAAHRLAARFPTRALLRAHPAPAERALEDLAAVVAAVNGPPLDTSSSGALAASLAAARAAAAAGSLDPGTVAAITQACTKPMPLAAYICAGAATDEEENGGGGGGRAGEQLPAPSSSSPSAFRHYALAAPLYTHFTSPIRRYADLLVHRLLLASLERDGEAGGGGEAAAGRGHHPLAPPPAPLPPPPPAWCDARGLLGPAAAATAAAHCNARKAAAKAAQDAAGRLYLAALLAKRPAVVAGVLPLAGPGGPRFFDAFIPSLGVEVRVHVEHHGRLSAGRPGRGGGAAGLALSAGWDGGTRTLTLDRAAAAGGRVAAPPPPLPAVGGVAPATLPLRLGPLSAVPLVIGAAPPAETGLPAPGSGSSGGGGEGCGSQNGHPGLGGGGPPPGGAAAGLRPELYAWIYAPGVAGGGGLGGGGGGGGQEVAGMEDPVFAAE